MTDADDLKLQIQSAIRSAENVQKIALMYEQAINQLRQEVLLLDLGSDNAYSRSIARITPLIGKDLPIDAEITGQVKSELQNWLPHV